MHRTLSALGASNIEAYFLPKGDNIHSTDATNALSQYGAAALIVLDQGSRAGPPILPGVPTLILDHHQSTVFPEEAKVWHLQGNLACRQHVHVFLCARQGVMYRDSLLWPLA